MNNIFFYLFLLTSSILFSQAQKHVKWSASYRGDKQTGEIIITAEIDKGWHSYSQKSSEGPIPTEFRFALNSEYELVGKTEESESKEEYDKTFEAKVYSFSEKAEFRQKIKLKNKGTRIAITVDYMVCSESMCIKEGPVELSVNAP